MKQIINPCNLCLPRNELLRFFLKASVAPKYLRDELTLLMLKAAAGAWVWICLRPFPVCHSPPPCFPVCFLCFPINKGRMPEMNLKKDNSETQIMVLVTITKSVIFLQISSKQTVSLCYFMYANLTWLSQIGHNIKNCDWNKFKCSHLKGNPE